MFGSWPIPAVPCPKRVERNLPSQLGIRKFIAHSVMQVDRVLPNAEASVIFGTVFSSYSKSYIFPLQYFINSKSASSFPPTYPPNRSVSCSEPARIQCAAETSLHADLTFTPKTH